MGGRNGQRERPLDRAEQRERDRDRESFVEQAMQKGKKKQETEKIEV